MATITYLVFSILVVMETFIIFGNGFVILLPNGNGIKLSEDYDSEKLLDLTDNQQSVHHYARHELCRTFEGKRYFYNAMKTKLCHIKLSTTANFVMDLCQAKSFLLDRWVSELFDFNGDGYISHFEKHFYTDDN